MLALRPGDHLCIAKLDRAFRNTVDCLQTWEELHKMQVTLHILNLGLDHSSRATAKLVLTLLAAIAEFDSALKSERVRESKAFCRATKRNTGRPRPWGYKFIGIKGKQYPVPFEQELALIAETVRLRKTGMSWVKISEQIQRLIARVEGKKFVDSKPINVGGRKWLPDICMKALAIYTEDVTIRDLADKCAGYLWRKKSFVRSNDAEKENFCEKV